MPDKEYISKTRKLREERLLRAKLDKLTKQYDTTEKRRADTAMRYDSVFRRNEELQIENEKLKARVETFPSVCPNCGQAPLQVSDAEN